MLFNKNSPTTIIKSLTKVPPNNNQKHQQLTIKQRKTPPNDNQKHHQMMIKPPTNNNQNTNK
ncbi:17861_t:CDS:2 [Dentiscutata erythropus]|uniref:17861_t:CDS:1 n=1 Tax=Dentiscutata erythropus TaxID=1348616 RepID=A0A9N8ZLD4_9GLOM|nr:17861_t:CDS:2 [Dentiscutata erythropus]